MTPFLPGSRREPSDEHDRARRLASDRLTGTLEHDEQAWLELHLAGCDVCRSAVAAWEVQRERLRAQPMPEPPRDLWARTRAAIDADAGRRRRSSLIPYGGLAATLVVAVVVGASVLSRPTVEPPTPSQTASQPSATPAPPEVTPRPTPIDVAVADVSWVERQDDGSYIVAVAPVAQVCSPEIRPDCPTLEAPQGETLAVDTRPRSIVASPAQQSVVVDATDPVLGGSVFVVALGASPSPSPSVAPSPSPTVEPSTPSPAPSTSAEPSPSPDASPIHSSQPSPSPAAGPVAIATDVVVIGQAAGFSPDGRWFAFSARPSDGSQGPDIYLWESGSTSAVALTSDHATVFSGWLGDRILASRVVQPGIDAVPEASPEPVVGVSVVIDPSTGLEAPILDRGAWRPVVDPSGIRVAFWQGTLVLAANGVDWLPDQGRLVLAELPAGWDPSTEPAPSDSPAPSLDPTEPAPSGAVASPSPEPSPSVSAPVVLADGPFPDWDIRWDETGQRFALWLADPSEPTIGRLSLHDIDADGRLDPDGPLVADTVALPGFSIKDGRLAFAVPPGQDGEGSRIVVVAWSGGASGRAESLPGSGETPVIIVR